MFSSAFFCFAPAQPNRLRNRGPAAAAEGKRLQTVGGGWGVWPRRWLRRNLSWREKQGSGHHPQKALPMGVFDRAPLNWGTGGGSGKGLN